MINSILKYIKIIVKSNISYFLLYCLVGFVTYFPALHGGFMGDDSGQIVSNIYIRSLHTIPLLFKGGTFYTGGIDNKLLSEYYRPLMIVWYTLIYSFAGLKPFYYHLLQLMLHIINSFLVFSIFARFLVNKKIAYLLAFIFLIHPINTETISYLGNIQDILFFFFGMLGFFFFIKRKPEVSRLFITQLLFLIALLSKEIALVFFIVLYSYIELFNIRKMKLWFFFSSVLTIGIYLYLRCGMASICTLGGPGSVVPIAKLPFGQRLLQIPAILFFYIKTYFFPKTLAIFQYWLAPHDIHGLYIPLVVSTLFFSFIVTVPFIFYFYRNRLNTYSRNIWYKNNALNAKTYAFFLVWLLTGLAAHIHILPLDSTVAERWFYFPQIGILGMLGVLFTLLKNKKKLYIFLIIIICIFAVRSYFRALDWSSPYRLYSKDILVSKHSSSLENNYGAMLFERGKIKEAEYHFRNATKLAPSSPIYWNNLAQVYEKKGDYKTAETYYLKSIENGRFYKAFEGYVNLLLIQGKTYEARKFLKDKAIPTFPFNATFKSKYEKTK